MTVNDGMPEWVASRVARILNREGKAVKDSRVLVLGVAYKQDIDDYRESPALRVIERLEVRGARVSYFDPWVPRYCYKGTENHSLPHLTAEAIASAILFWSLVLTPTLITHLYNATPKPFLTQRMP